MKCSEYEFGEPETVSPCHCPICGGFLKIFSINDKFLKCKKCGAELIILPEVEDNEEQEHGKICPISLNRKVKSS
jgi:hypothetical protein